MEFGPHFMALLPSLEDLPGFRRDWTSWSRDSRKALAEPGESRDGLNLRLAMLFYGEKDLTDRLFQFEDMDLVGRHDSMSTYLDFRNFGDPIPDLFLEIVEYCETRTNLERSLIEKLCSGVLSATGFSSSSPVDDPARPIHADRWRSLTPNFEKSQAKGAGIRISDILVFSTPRRKDKSQARPRRFAKGLATRWYREWVEKNELAGTKPSRESDLTAAREALGDDITRELLRELRRELAPSAWRSRGRRSRDA